MKVDFKRDARDERLYLLELNPRFNLWHHPGAVAGVDLPALVYQDCLQPGSARSAARVRPGVRWLRPREDWKAAAPVMSPLRWLGEIATVEVNEGLCLRDPWPGLVDLAGTAGRKLARLPCSSATACPPRCTWRPATYRAGSASSSTSVRHARPPDAQRAAPSRARRPPR